MPSINHNPLQRCLNDIPQRPTTSCQCLRVGTSRCAFFCLQPRLRMMTMAAPRPRSIFTIHDVQSPCLASTTTPSSAVSTTYHNIQPHRVDACMSVPHLRMMMMMMAAPRPGKSPPFTTSDPVTTGSSRHGRAGVSFLVATVGSTVTTLL